MRCMSPWPTRRCGSVGALARDSYLKSDAVIQAAKQTGAEAIHPGYGFLSENAEIRRGLQAEAEDRLCRAAGYGHPRHGPARAPPRR
jgi:biotin carboxylase